MKNKLHLLIALSLVLVAGCVSHPHGLKAVEVGMTKTALFRAMGKPSNVAGQGDVEYITYTLKGEDCGFGKPTVTFKLVKGVVDAYGQIQPAPSFDAINGVK